MNVGIVGGGQLARMLAIAGYPLGLRFRFLDAADDACAFSLGESLVGAFDDEQCLDALIDGADVVTYEFENVSLRGVEYAAEHVRVYPPPAALALKQDRLNEKRLFRNLDIPTATFSNLESDDDFEPVIESVGFPLVLKSRSLGYDGKGQILVPRAEDLDAAWTELNRVPVIAERFVEFDREVSIVAARGVSGDTAFYPISENVHKNSILHESTSRPSDPVAGRAREYAERLLKHFDYVGVLALELFQRGDELIANEYAPRVHNSGHWTIEGAETSQFENHLRAILGLPLGSTEPVGHVTMLNRIGALPDSNAIASIPGAHIHWYDKKPRPGRKIGHITVRGDSDESVRERILQLRESL